MNPIATYPELAPAAMSLQVEELESLDAAESDNETVEEYVAAVLLTVAILIALT